MNSFRKIERYWHTLRYLKPIQFYGRVWFRLARPKPDIAPAPPVRQAGKNWQIPARRAASLIGPDEFLFIGQTGILSQIGWDGDDREKLWRYNQHYFDDLNAKEAEKRCDWHHALLRNWVENNPPAKGNGWEPYPTSLRIVNWVKWAMAGNYLSDDFNHSLAVQARWLTNRLEIHLLGNHLFSNAKALVFAGFYFEGSEAEGWLALGLKILRREVDEQILPDGGHFERSTMYHVLALEDMLDLCNIARCYPDTLAKGQLEQTTKWSTFIGNMLHWTKVMVHPDGDISFFNDAALEIAPAISETYEYADRMGFSSDENLEEIEWLQPSGYARLTKGNAVALLDMAPIGPDHLPGHSHADTLSFELSLYGHRVLVNSGTSCYGLSNERLRQRGTAAHNTVIVDGENSSEVWSGFRVARRARVVGAEMHYGATLTASCSHDGYKRLSKSIVHNREWELAKNELTISDDVTGSMEQSEARYHFHPEITISIDSSGKSGGGVLPEGQVFCWETVCSDIKIEQTTWHPKFGESIKNQCLVLKLDQGQCQLKITWT